MLNSLNNAEQASVSGSEPLGVRLLTPILHTIVRQSGSPKVFAYQWLNARTRALLPADLTADVFNAAMLKISTRDNPVLVLTPHAGWLWYVRFRNRWRDYQTWELHAYKRVS